MSKFQNIKKSLRLSVFKFHAHRYITSSCSFAEEILFNSTSQHVHLIFLFYLQYVEEKCKSIRIVCIQYSEKFYKSFVDMRIYDKFNRVRSLCFLISILQQNDQFNLCELYVKNGNYFIHTYMHNSCIIIRFQIIIFISQFHKKLSMLKNYLLLMEKASMAR